LYSTRVLELIQIFILYSVMIFGIGTIITKPFTKGRGIKYWICTNLVVGNFYIINVTFLLAYMKCLHRFSTILALLGGAVLIRYIVDRKKVEAYWTKKYGVVIKLLKREYGSRLLAQQILRGTISRVKEGFIFLGKGRVLELVLLMSAMVINVYYYSYQPLNFVSYAAPDVEVHLYWIQSLVGGKIFPAGVYPFGMHCIGAVLAIVFDISAVTIARMLGVVTSFYIMLLCYLLVRYLCKLKYAPIVGFYIFSIANIMENATYNRYSAMISQEYAMIFLVPIMYFLYLYLNNKGMQELVLFGMAFSLTLAIHFYITAVAAFFFLAIGAVYLYRMIKRRMLIPIIICGIISTLTAIAPLALGLCFGYELEQSFKYGASVIMDDEAMYSGNEIENVEEVVEEEKTLQEKVEDSIFILDKFVFSDVRFVWLFIAVIVLVLVLWGVQIYQKRVTDSTLEFLSQMIYLLIILLETVLYAWDILIIVEPRRMGIFVAYMLPVVIAIPFEVLHLIKQDKKYWGYLSNGVAIVSLTSAVYFICAANQVKTLPDIYYFQTSGAMRATCDIIRHCEDETWTIVSSVNETALTYNKGYHYELYDFLMEMEEYEKGTELYIPTEYVFFYVEKMPIQKYGYSFAVDDEILRKRECVSKEAALESLGNEYSNVNDFYKNKRMQLMSRMYYWAQTYQQYFPDEMTIFYEDEELVVYCLKQNTYALNNLAINYREELVNEGTKEWK